MACKLKAKARFTNAEKYWPFALKIFSKIKYLY